MTAPSIRTGEGASEAIRKTGPEEMIAVRESILAALRAELVGPAPGLPAVQSGINGSARAEEILRPQDSPRLRYGAGILFPQRLAVPTQDTDEGEADEGEDSTDGATEAAIEEGESSTRRVVGARSEADTEQEVNRANEYLPSAIGLTALAEIPSHGLKVRVRAARYEKNEIPGRGRTDSNGGYHPYNAWWRIPIDHDVQFTREELLGTGPTTIEKTVITGSNDPVLKVHVFSRALSGISPGDTKDQTERRMVTVTLLNRTDSQASRAADEDCFFQCRFAVEAISGQPCFLTYPERASDADANEDSSLRLLYRNQRVFAVGHGCAPNWDGDRSVQKDAEWQGSEDARSEVRDFEAAGAIRRVWTEVIPVYEIKPILPRELPDLHLSMRALADLESTTPLELCERLVEEYRRWIAAETARADRELSADLRTTAEKHLRNCDSCLRRIEGGIGLLRSDRRVRRAFSFMNRAMYMQQIHYRMATNEIRHWVRVNGRLRLDRAYVAPDYTLATAAWYPFQLAFILMNLRSLALPDCEERALVDVIWFPTGGGKTEAYLGLTAYTLFLRRLRNPDRVGTAALMRYTLRLLTAQQYQRAASLICACEIVRRDDPDALGQNPITIGLWVGGSVTPNKERDAVEALRRLWREGSDNPFILLSCPWCGAEMGPVKVGGAYETPGYRLLASPQRVRFVCKDDACAFSDDRGLPLLVIDEQMYAEPPSLLIGTVDKFALLPWYPDASNLLGQSGGTSGGPPDLIIQDELHLISGPLGSMVGLYETLVDTFCTNRDGIPPKIIASTATISRAPEQVRSLYAKTPFLFPPQGLDAGDSFFAVQREDRPGRLYAGVFASGLPSQQTAMIRVLSALLQGPASLGEYEASVIDPYWTLIGYFNSIRELGSAATLVSADIREYLGVMHERLGLGPMYGPESASRRRFLSARGALELTGRVSGYAVTEALQQLFTRYEGNAESQRQRSRGSERADPPVDVCLATNMIQVGLDVPRLGLMVVAGQPKMTSEYIQATSRVGRNTPGLVVTVYSPAKPRDRSHYEHFRAYHQSIYRYVEPTSVTPFALPVRERALHALVVALARVWGGDPLRQDPSLGVPAALAERIRKTILARVAAIDSEEVDEANTMVLRFIANWIRLPPARYGDFAPPNTTVPMMYPSGSEALPAWQDRAHPTPSSLRNVDAECSARVITEFNRA